MNNNLLHPSYEAHYEASCIRVLDPAGGLALFVDTDPRGASPAEVTARPRILYATQDMHTPLLALKYLGSKSIAWGIGGAQLRYEVVDVPAGTTVGALQWRMARGKPLHMRIFDAGGIEVGAICERSDEPKGLKHAPVGRLLGTMNDDWEEAAATPVSYVVQLRDSIVAHLQQSYPILKAEFASADDLLFARKMVFGAIVLLSGPRMI